MFDPSTYAQEWCAAWNAHDLDRLLLRFHEAVVFTSPVAQKLLPGSGGTVRGKAALRHYWSEGLRRIPNLHFEILGAYEGVDCLTINFVNQEGRVANEVLIFEQDLIVQGFATHMTPATAPTFRP